MVMAVDVQDACWRAVHLLQNVPERAGANASPYASVIDVVSVINNVPLLPEEQ